MPTGAPGGLLTVSRVVGAGASNETPERRNLRLFTGFACFLLAPVDWLLLGGFSPTLFALRLITLGVMVAAAFVPLRLKSARARDGFLLAAGAVNTLILCWQIALTGGRESLYFPVLFLLPCVAIAMAHEHPMHALIGGVCAAVSAALFAVQSGHNLWHATVWAALFTFAGSICWNVTRTVVKVKRREVEAAERRIGLEAQLRQSELSRARADRLAVIGQLAAGVAQELAAPLAQVRAGLVDGAPGREARASLDHIARVLGDLKGFARDEARGLDDGEPCSIASLFDEAERQALLKRPEGGRVERLIPTDLPMVSGSRSQLVQVLRHLVLNAFEAVGSRPPRIQVRAIHSGDRVRVDIDDNGPGIPPELEGRLFQPFFTTKSPGLGVGLGLALSRELIERSRGTLSATNNEQGGARFTLELPVNQGVSVRS